MYCGVDNPTLCGYAHLFETLCYIVFHVYLWFHVDYWRVMDGIWVVCLYVQNKVGDLRIELIRRFTIYPMFLWYCFDVIGSCTAFMPSFGTRSDSVKPTGHARFSVELYRLIWNKNSIFLKEINWIKWDFFSLFLFLCCETLSLIHNAFFK